MSDPMVFIDQGVIQEECLTDQFFSNPEKPRPKDFFHRVQEH